jgi:hypothetical protein
LAALIYALPLLLPLRFDDDSSNFRRLAADDALPPTNGAAGALAVPLDTLTTAALLVAVEASRVPSPLTVGSPAVWVAPSVADGVS